MNKGPRQTPSNESEGSFEEWQNYHSPEKSKLFDYNESTRENIGDGESQKFHYEGNDLPEKD